MGDGPVVQARANAAGSTASSALVDGLIQDVTRALFRSYGAPLELDGSPVQKTLEHADFVTVVGFSSSSFSGSLLLALPASILQKTLPAAGASVADWSGELANQLLGRFRNRLLDYQLSIQMTLPVVISGGRFALPGKTRPITRHFSFLSDWGKLFVRLEAELSPDVEFVRLVSAEGGGALSEGELLLF